MDNWNVLEGELIDKLADPPVVAPVNPLDLEEWWDEEADVNDAKETDGTFEI